MATAEQIKSLIRSYYNEDSGRFFTVALQVAAHEARLGHGALAHDIRKIVEKAKLENRQTILEFPKELQGFVLTQKSNIPKAALIVTEELAKRIERIMLEQRQRVKLKSHGLEPRRRILATGPPGTGKTMTAHVLAHELRMPLQTVQVDKIVTKFMGETAAKLRQVFDMIQERPGIYLFDEFDAIGGERTLENDVGEMRRVLNSFLQFIERDTSDSIIFASTNSPNLLDRALYRRFDDVLYYQIPASDERRQLVRNILGGHLESSFSWDSLLAISDGLSQAEIDLACRDALKQAILAGKNKVSHQLVEQMIKERKSNHFQMK